ncbi:MAG: aspartate-semialdehyde dehydrogenase [Candidatus Binatia bacterium]
MKKSSYALAVVGATGLVGQQIIETLEERRFPIADLRLYASLRSAGEAVRCGDVTARVELLDGARFDATDVVFVAAGQQVSAEWAGRVAGAGAVVIDTSQLFASDPDVPLVVPEVNGSELAGCGSRRLIASPDSSAVALAVALNPLHAAACITRVVASTLEPVSGAGRRGVEELQRQTVALMNGRSVERECFPNRIAFNVLPQVGEFVAGGASQAEQQTVGALRRLLQHPELTVSVTRVRVPLFYGEAIAVNVETLEKVSAAAAREIFRTAPGALLRDDTSALPYPTPADAVGQDATYVGRIREDEETNGLDFWITIDNIRKGSAVNAVQIAELLVRDYL